MRLNLNELKAKCFSSGGFSVNASTGAVPTSGYMVSVGEEKTYPAYLAEVCFEALVAAFIQGNRSALCYDGAYLGGWLHDGLLFLDVSSNVDTLEKARALGRAYSQIAVWDVQAKQEISV